LLSFNMYSDYSHVVAPQFPTFTNLYKFIGLNVESNF
jgi:hypothetical protein